MAGNKHAAGAHDKTTLDIAVRDPALRRDAQDSLFTACLPLRQATFASSSIRRRAM
ncbi:hypothetical protein [Rhodanobacter sp. DHB23]|uniref:hypothetical protein n=1 Tax=Rhodanobacter sp. DHB23 TaxID=2775923 RepID=UPI00178089BF|nr:hypothetical protein [Rhodanobacter sp. DHB23]